MGYCIHQREAKFHVKRSNFVPAVKALQAMRGTYSWARDFQKLTSLVKILSAWRWEAKRVDEEEGDIVGIQFCGEKAGDDLALFKVLAPFVEAGSFVHMVGEDGAQWKWIFDGKTCVEKQGKVSFE